jgi:hypothetical protein
MTPEREQEIYARVADSLRWAELPQIKIGSRLSLSASDWLSARDVSVLPLEIWKMIGDYVAADLEAEVELDRVARPYGEVPEDPPDSPDWFRDHLGYFGEEKSPWHRKSRIDFQQRWRPLRLYHAIKPLRASMDTYFLRNWIENASFWVRRVYSGLRPGYWVSMFKEFRGSNNEFAVFRGNYVTCSSERNLPVGGDSETNVREIRSG